MTLLTLTEDQFTTINLGVELNQLHLMDEFILGKRIEVSLPEAWKSAMACAEYFVANKNAIKVVGQAFLPAAPTKFLGVLKEVGVLVFPFHPASEVGLEIAKIKPTFTQALSEWLSFHIGEPVKITIGACCSVVVWSKFDLDPNPTWLQNKIDRLNRDEWNNHFDCG